MPPDISVIIPVYNSEKYLVQCIGSLTSQSHKNCEFIFVNDGSTDNSLQILEEAKSKDSRIIIISQVNQGVSIARNKGIEIAKAKYIAFVDSDDEVHRDLYKNLYSISETYNPDIILFNMVTSIGKHKSITNYNFPKNKLLPENWIKAEIYNHLISKDDLFSPCNKLYKTQILKSHKINFPEKNNLSEDNIFNIRYFGLIKSFYYLDFDGYFCKANLGSATRNFFKTDYVSNFIDIYRFDYKKYLDTDLSDEIIENKKADKFVHNICSLVFEYFSAPVKISLFRKLGYVKNMISNPEVAAIIQKTQSVESKSKFDFIFFKALKYKLVIILYILVKYSNLRGGK